eukprot:scaffold56791_cov56-Phaeocystis_antarctica.AAC.3
MARHMAQQMHGTCTAHGAMERTGHELAHLGRDRIEVRQLAISGDRDVDAHEVRAAVAIRSPDPLQRAVVAVTSPFGSVSVMPAASVPSPGSPTTPPARMLSSNESVAPVVGCIEWVVNGVWDRHPPLHGELVAGREGLERRLDARIVVAARAATLRLISVHLGISKRPELGAAAGDGGASALGAADAGARVRHTRTGCYIQKYRVARDQRRHEERAGECQPHAMMGRARVVHGQRETTGGKPG